MRIADGTLSKVGGIGSITISENITLQSVLYVQNLDCNLLSISNITGDLKCVAKFFPSVCVFQVLDSERTIGSAKLCAGLYLLKAKVSENKSSKSSFVASSLDKNNHGAEMLWHSRMGHPNFMYLLKLFPSLTNKSEKFPDCEVCQFSKHSCTSFPALSNKPTHSFSLIRNDVRGPSQVNNITGSRWFVTFIDDHTRITLLFLMKNKSEVGQIFQNFSILIENQFQTRMQVLKIDNGTEYFQS